MTIVCELYVTPCDKTSYERCILKDQVEGVLVHKTNPEIQKNLHLHHTIEKLNNLHELTLFQSIVDANQLY